MYQSTSISNIASSLLKAQRKIENAAKSAANPFFKSKYANLTSVMEACKGPLNEEGIVILQPVNSDENGEYVETMLLHESGEFFMSRMKLFAAKDDMQAYGSAVSYARRYGLQSMVFVGAEDDDGEAAMKRSTAAVTNIVAATPVEAPKPAAKSSTGGFKRLGAAPAPVAVTPKEEMSF